MGGWVWDVGRGDESVGVKDVRVVWGRDDVPMGVSEVGWMMSGDVGWVREDWEVVVRMV